MSANWHVEGDGHVSLSFGILNEFLIVLAAYDSLVYFHCSTWKPHFHVFTLVLLKRVSFLGKASRRVKSLKSSWKYIHVSVSFQAYLTEKVSPENQDVSIPPRVVSQVTDLIDDLSDIFRSGSESGSDNGGRVGSQNYGKLASKTLVLVRNMAFSKAWRLSAAGMTLWLLQETKRFYLDVKENKRGRFIKIAEVGRSDGRKNQIMMSLRAAAQFRQHLVIIEIPTRNVGRSEHVVPHFFQWTLFLSKVSMIEFIHDLEPVDPSNLRQNELKSESMAKDDKKYHLDLKVNPFSHF